MHDPVLNSSIQTDELLNVDNKEVINSSIKTNEFSPVKTDEIIDLLPFNFLAIDFRSISSGDE